MVKGGQSNQKVTGGTKKNVGGVGMPNLGIKTGLKCMIPGNEKDPECKKLKRERDRARLKKIDSQQLAAADLRGLAAKKTRNEDDQLPRVLVHCIKDPSKSLHDPSRLSREPGQPAGFYMSKYFESMAEIGKTAREEENYIKLAGEGTGDNTPKAKAKEEINGETPVLIEKTDPRCKNLLDNRYSEFYCALFTKEQYKDFKEAGFEKVFGKKIEGNDTTPGAKYSEEDCYSFIAKPLKNPFLARDFSDAFTAPTKMSDIKDAKGYDGKEGNKGWRYLYTESVTGNASFRELCNDKVRSCIEAFKKKDETPENLGKIFLEDGNYFPENGSTGDRGPGHLISLMNDGTADMGSMGRGDFVQHSLKKLIVYLIAIASRQNGAGSAVWSERISSAEPTNRLELKLPKYASYFEAAKKLVKKDAASLEDEELDVLNHMKDSLKLFYSPLTPRVDKHVAITKEMRTAVIEASKEHEDPSLKSRLPNELPDDVKTAAGKVQEGLVDCLEEPPNTMTDCGIFVPTFSTAGSDGKDVPVNLKDNNGNNLDKQAQDDALKECIFVGYDVTTDIMTQIKDAWKQSKVYTDIKEILGEKSNKGFNIYCPPSMVMKTNKPPPLLDGNGADPDFISEKKSIMTSLKQMVSQEKSDKQREEKDLFSNVLLTKGFDKLYSKDFKTLESGGKEAMAHNRKEFKDFRERIWLLKNGKCYGEFTGNQKIPYAWDSEDLCFHFTDAPQGNWITAGWSNQEKFFDTAESNFIKYCITNDEREKIKKQEEQQQTEIADAVKTAAAEAPAAEEETTTEAAAPEAPAETAAPATSGGKKTRKRNNKTRKRKTHKKKDKKLRRKRR